MSFTRSEWRNVQFYDGSNGQLLGGFFQAGSITEANFFTILSTVLLAVEKPLTVQDQGSGQVLGLSNDILNPGNYNIFCQDPLIMTDEQWIARITSYSLSGREESFRTGVRQRDGRCIISGRVNELAQWGRWHGFQAAHIFPLGSENLWNEYGYGVWITNMDPTTGLSKINSVQNGLLMSSHLHELFDQYLLSINPDDGYKVILFTPGFQDIDGKVLHPACRDPNNPDHVADELLRWHFRQSVLANMRRSGEPLFEADFPPGADQIATLRNEPYGKERLEMELSLRLEPRVREAHQS